MSEVRPVLRYVLQRSRGGASLLHDALTQPDSSSRGSRVYPSPLVVRVRRWIVSSPVRIRGAARGAGDVMALRFTTQHCCEWSTCRIAAGRSPSRVRRSPSQLRAMRYCDVLCRRGVATGTLCASDALAARRFQRARMARACSLKTMRAHRSCSSVSYECIARASAVGSRVLPDVVPNTVTPFARTRRWHL